MKQQNIAKKILGNMPYKINRISKGIAVIILAAIVFAFIHSEVGLFDFDSNNHGAHDYCEIVKNTNTHSKILREDLPKLELNKDICIHCFEKIEVQVTRTCFERTDQNIIVKHTTELYLFNRAFLI